MNERLPYEEQLSQQWNDLPLPDENMAWTDMKRRLDEEDKRRIFPFWLTGCAGWGLLGILLLGLGWWILRPEKWFKQKQEMKQVNTVIEKNNKTEKDTIFNKTDTGVTLARNNDSTLLISSSKKDSSAVETEAGLPGSQKINNNTTTKNKTVITTGQGVVNKKKKEKARNNSDTLTIGKRVAKNDTMLPADKNKQDKIPVDPGAIIVQTIKPKIDSATSIVKTVAVVDSVQKVTKDSVIKKPQQDTVTQDKKSKKDSTKNKKMIFSAGLGLQQQLPVAGQKFVPYNSQGRKGTLADYIPSVYIRMDKPEKWFLQSEFRYGAPQYTKEFIYRQKAVPDTGANPQFTSITSSSLKKTFYHQLPVTFNYFIRPNWSVGAGLQWNKFKAAVNEKSVTRRNNFTLQDSLVSKLLETVTKDSATEFAKSYFQFALETQYKWKRFSFGARYSFGLQPYIKFTIPGQPEKQERNNALQIFIRYELWKSKNK